MAWTCERVNFEKLKPAKAAEDHALHVAAVEWSLAEPIVISSKEDIKSRGNWAKGFEPYHHQVENLMRFCRMLPVTLLADDVGLGKTISAGLVLGELMARKRVSRCLVICPSILGPQWVEELGTKFNIPAVFATGQELVNTMNRSAVPVVVTTYQTASKKIASFRSDQFDMLILDEAHKLRNLYGTPNPPLMARRIRQALESRIFKYVLMLTATPMQNRMWDLYSLIDLLTVAKGHRNPFGSPSDFRLRYIGDPAGRKLQKLTAAEFRTILRQYVVRIRREDARLKFPERIVETHKLRATDVEDRMAEIVADEIEGLGSFQQISLGQAMMSSPQALASQLENMAARGSMAQSVADEMRGLADTRPKTAKLEGLLKLVHELRQKRPSDWRIVVFTLRKDTQDAIGRALIAEGISVDFIRGGSSSANQRTVERFRSDPPKINLVVSTDAGAEGINLQSGNVLVNYDLPWNPMVMEQRIGRVQRLASVHENVIVVNLVIANSVEERVVGRLIEKLQSIADTIGDIEAILESTGQDEEGSFEEMIRKLVVSSLVGQNVEQATQAKTKSIEAAKVLLREQREHLEQILGPAPFAPQQGPKPPKFDPVKPSIPAEEFVMRALVNEGATLRPRADDTIDVVRAGHATERITFKPEVAEQESTGVFMGNAPKLFLPGRPAFERLLQRWLQRSGHSIRDLTGNSEALTLLTTKAWCDSVPDAEFQNFATKETKKRISGGVTCRVKAANGVDSLEKLIRIHAKLNEHVPNDEEMIEASPILRDNLAADTSFDGIERFIASHVTTDQDIDAFCQFYEGCRSEEISKAGGDARQKHKIEGDFAPKIFADVVAMTGLRYDLVRASVAFLLDKEHRYEAELELIPASRKVVSEPERRVCSITGRSLPLPCIHECDISGKPATAHLLAKSAVSGRMVLPEFSVRCDLTGDVLLQDEALTSDVSGKTARKSAFDISPLSGRRGLRQEFANCDFTGSRVLTDELLISEVSGMHFRRDQRTKSSVSGKFGHASEFFTCAESGDTILPEESATSAVSETVVRRDLVVESQKPPHRIGRTSETEVCSVTGLTLLRDEVVASAVSGLMIDKDKAVFSQLSGKPASPHELVRCAVSGQFLLPSETGVSCISERRVRRDLLRKSPLSRRQALEDELIPCEITKTLMLPDELIKSEESGRLFRKDEGMKSSVSGRVGHKSEMVQCSATKQFVLNSEADRSAISGQLYSRSLLLPSTKATHRLGTADEVRVCALSGKQLLVDEVVTSAVSGKQIDRDLAAFSGVSKQAALPDEVVQCEATGQTLLPCEAARSDLSNKLVQSTLLEASPLSGRKGLKSEFKTCDVTGTTVLLDELLKSDESGKLFRSDEEVRSTESGRVGHRSEAVKCAGTLAFVLKSEAEQSAISGQTYRKSLLFASEKSPERFGLQNETVTCAKSGKRLLIDEAVRSAVSDKWVDRDLAVLSARSNKPALPEEMVTCGENGAQLLPSETGICAITGKRVDNELLGASELSGRTAIRTLLDSCAVTGRKALPSELQACDLTGKRVDPEELETCAVSHKRAIKSLFVRSDISGVPVLPEHAVCSPVSKRFCTPQESLPCTWSGVLFPKDEIVTCRLTGLTFSRDLMTPSNEFRVLREMLDGKQSGTHANDLVGWMATNLNGQVTGLKHARCTFSPEGSIRAVCGEMRAMLGLKVRYAGLLVNEKGTRQVLGRIAVGKRHQGTWTPGV